MKNKTEAMNEQIIYECKTHWIILVMPAIMSLIVSAIMGFLIANPSAVMDYLLADSARTIPDEILWTDKDVILALFVIL